MIISARYLVDRLRLVRSRADEVRELRRRLAAEAQDGRAGADELALAGELRSLRQALSDALGTIQACSSCARGCPQPAGRWDGGRCCSGRTAELFSDEEIAALCHGGTRAGDLQAPRSEHAGCAFRGPQSCSLPVAHRPNVCVSYLCTTAVHEVYDRGMLDLIDELKAQIAATFARFVTARSERRLDEAMSLPAGWRADPSGSRPAGLQGHQES